MSPDERLTRQKLALEIRLRRSELALANKQFALAKAQFDLQNQQGFRSGFKILLSPTGVVLIGAALGLIGTAVSKYWDYQVTDRQQQTSVILKASEVPTSLSWDQQRVTRARNLLWFADAGYIVLPETFRHQLVEAAEIPANTVLSAPVIQSASAPVIQPPLPGPNGSQHFEFPVLNQAPIDPSGLDVDVFSCTTAGAQFDAGRNLATALAVQADSGTRIGNTRLGRIRYTGGPEHRRPGNLIFYDPQEIGFAQALLPEAARLSGQAFALAANTGDPTGFYVSIYLCGR